MLSSSTSVDPMSLMIPHNDFFNTLFSGVNREPEKRSQQCIVLSFWEDGSLLDLEEEGGIPSPYELLETILNNR